MWLAISTRPDISNTVRSVARYCFAPRVIRWNSTLGILTYIDGTCGFGITYQRGTTVGIFLEVFADAYYASKATGRGSVSGGAIMCGGACVCSFSRTQKCVTISTSEAECVALGDAMKELLFLRRVWRFMIPGKGMPCSPVFEDNQGALHFFKNPVSNSNSKHIDVRHHFLRELVRQWDIILNHVPFLDSNNKTLRQRSCKTTEDTKHFLRATVYRGTAVLVYCTGILHTNNDGRQKGWPPVCSCIL